MARRFPALSLTIILSTENGEWTYDLVQPGLCGWEGTSLIQTSGVRHLESLKSTQHGTGFIDRLRIALAPKKRIANAKNILDATLDDVKQRLGR